MVVVWSSGCFGSGDTVNGDGRKMIPKTTMAVMMIVIRVVRKKKMITMVMKKMMMTMVMAIMVDELKDGLRRRRR